MHVHYERQSVTVLFTSEMHQHFFKAGMHAARGTGAVKYIRFWMHIGIFFSIFWMHLGIFLGIFYICSWCTVAVIRFILICSFALLDFIPVFKNLLCKGALLCNKVQSRAKAHLNAIKYRTVKQGKGEGSAVLLLRGLHLERQPGILCGFRCETSPTLHSSSGKQNTYLQGQTHHHTHTLYF